MSRYEIREKESTELQRGMGFEDTVYLVWDTEQGKRVPFGTYATRSAAARRIQRAEET